MNFSCAENPTETNIGARQKAKELHERFDSRDTADGYTEASGSLSNARDVLKTTKI
jgi:hypothetical protein